MPIRFEFYNPLKHQQEFHSFISETYGEKSFLLQPEYVDWWFASSPFRTSSYATDILLAFDGDQVVAMNGHIAGRLQVNRNSIPIAWIVNTMVLSKYRRGLGLSLFNESVNFFKNLGTISFNHLSKPVLTHFGFELFEERTLDRAISMLSSDIKDSADVSEKTYPGTAASAYSGTVKNLFAQDLTNVVSLFNRVKGEYGLTSERNEQYYLWRFLRHPRGQYQLIGVEKDSDLKAFAAIRTEGSELRAMRIVDLFGEKEYIPELLAGIRSKAREASCAFVDFYGTRKNEAEFIEAGYRWLQGEEKSEVPFLLNPVMHDRTFNENVGLLLPKSDGVEKEIKYLDDVYFTKADADRDRP